MDPAAVVGHSPGRGGGDSVGRLTLKHIRDEATLKTTIKAGEAQSLTGHLIDL